MPAAGHSVKNTVTAQECAELHKMMDKEKKKKWKVLMENPLFCVRVIGLHFNAIFVSKGSQTFTLHSLVSFAFLWVHPFIVHIEIGNSSCKNKNLLKFLKPSMV